MTRFSLSRADIKRACDPLRVVSFREGGLSRKIAFDGTVVFGSLGVLTLVVLIVFGAPLSSLFLVAFGFLGLIVMSAREYLADLGAGLVLRVVKPYSTGDTVHLYSTDANEYIDATVIKLGAVHTTLAAPSGVITVPNHAMVTDEAA